MDIAVIVECITEPVDLLMGIEQAAALEGSESLRLAAFEAAESLLRVVQALEVRAEKTNPRAVSS